MTDNLPEKPDNRSEILFYQAADGRSRIRVRLEGDTVWLTQKLMAELFQVAVPTINEHIKNIYKEGELAQAATVRKFRIVQKEGSRDVQRNVDFYNLDVILSVGDPTPDSRPKAGLNSLSLITATGARDTVLGKARISPGENL